MSEGDDLVNLLIKNSNGRSQLIKVQKGSKLYLSSGSTKGINRNTKEVMNSNEDWLKTSSVNTSEQSGNYNVPAVVRVRPSKPKPLSSVQVQNGQRAFRSNSPARSQLYANDQELENMEHFNGCGYSGVLPESDDSSPLSPLNDNSQKEFLSVVLDECNGNPNRKRQNSNFGPKRAQLYNKRRRVDKSGKGLRHFSMKVCEKVRCKGSTTYNEVADELVEEFTNPANKAFIGEQYDQKNIRRRVYDALNVLMAMNIISKVRKEIKWIGLPTNTLHECITLINEKKRRMDQVKEKLRHLYDLILHQVSYKQLVQRNRENEQSVTDVKDPCRLHIPFILVSTSKKTFVDCNISHDKTEYLMLYNDKFEIHDDVEILKRMNLVLGLDKGVCSEKQLEIAKKMVPKSLEKYVEKLAQGDTDPTMADLRELLRDKPKLQQFSLASIHSKSGYQYQSKTDKEKMKQRPAISVSASEDYFSSDEYLTE